MGRVREKIVLRNQEDLIELRLGYISKNKVRSVKLDALVDTGATMISMPKSVIEKLGLRCTGEIPVRTANGKVVRRVFGYVEITMKKRTNVFDVLESPEDCPPLIGYLVLERLDLVVNPALEKVTFNPESGDYWMVDLYFCMT